MQCISYDSSTLVAIMACTAPLTQDLLHYTHHINMIWHHLRLRNSRRVSTFCTQLSYNWIGHMIQPRPHVCTHMHWRYSAGGQRRFQHDSQTTLGAAVLRVLRLQSAVCDSRRIRWVIVQLNVPRTRPPNLYWLLSHNCLCFNRTTMINCIRVVYGNSLIICHLCSWPGS